MLSFLTLHCHHRIATLSPVSINPSIRILSHIPSKLFCFCLIFFLSLVRLVSLPWVPPKPVESAQHPKVESPKLSPVKSKYTANSESPRKASKAQIPAPVVNKRQSIKRQPKSKTQAVLKLEPKKRSVICIDNLYLAIVSLYSGVGDSLIL